MADHAACSAGTTQPLFGKSAGREASASSSRSAHTVAALGVQMPQPDSDVELAGEHGVPDRAAPQHARIAGVGVEVRQLADGPRRLDHRVLVVEVGQRDRCGPHQRAVARAAAGAAGAAVPTPSRARSAVITPSIAAARSTELGLDPDVLGAA